MEHLGVGGAPLRLEKIDVAIDTQELRRKVNSTDIVDHIDLHANIKPFLSELLDRLEVAESTRRDYYQNWMTALDRNAELLAKLEAAEKERDDVAQQLVQSEIGKREISEAHDAVTGRLSVLADENTALRAKIADMEKKEPK